MKWKEFVQSRAWKKWDKSQWAILLLVGILLMVVALPTGTRKREEAVQKEVEQVNEAPSRSGDYAKELEERLEAALSKIAGAGLVEVMITLEDDGESVVEKELAKEESDLQETDSQGGIRSQKSSQSSHTAVYQEESGTKTPFVGKEKAPKIAGVLIVAQGGGETAVKQNISDAVMALFQIDVNRIKVVKMNIQEEEK